MSAETGAAHTGPAQVHGGWGPGPDGGGGYGLPPPGSYLQMIHADKGKYFSSVETPWAY